MKSKMLVGVAVGVVLSVLVTGEVWAKVYSTQSRRPTATVTPEVRPTGLRLLRACVAIEDAVKVRMEGLVRLAMKMKEKFGSIVDRTETFYTGKILPTGVTVGNYDELVAEIASKSAAVDEQLAEVGASVEEFSCDIDEPKVVLNAFRLEMQAVKRGLADYRTAIKNLIVAVRTAVGEGVTPTPTP